MPVVEVTAQLALIAVALVAVGGQDPAGWSARTTAVLVLVAGAVAAALLATAGWVSDNRRAVRIAGAVAVYAAVVLLPPAVGAGAPAGMWALTCSVALLGVVGFLALAVRASADRAGDRIAAAVVAGAVALATAALAVVTASQPGLAPPAGLPGAADLVVWSGTGAAALVMYIAGSVADRSLLRCTALAFAALAAANAVRIAAGAGAIAAALQLAAVAMLLVVAVRFGRAEVGTVTGRRGRLVDAELAVGAAARRQQEMHDLAVGLSGAARVLSRAGSGFGPDDRRLLAAAAAGFDRLRRIAAGETVPAPGAIGTILGDLAVVHQANGLDVRVDVDGDPGAVLEVGALVEVLTALLVDCAEQAPGARVWLRADPVERRLRIAVTDGPGLAPETVAALVQRGGSGPRPAPAGLALGTGYAERGTLTVTSDPDAEDAGAWSAVLDLPVVDGRAAP